MGMGMVCVFWTYWKLSLWFDTILYLSLDMYKNTYTFWNIALSFTASIEIPSAEGFSKSLKITQNPVLEVRSEAGESVMRGGQRKETRQHTGNDELRVQGLGLTQKTNVFLLLLQVISRPYDSRQENQIAHRKTESLMLSVPNTLTG